MRSGARLTAGHLLCSYPFPHTGVAKALVLRLKYRGIRRAAVALADGMVRLLPADAAVLVPVPRVPIRAHLYGIDPAAELAARIGVLASIPVVHALRAPLWWPRQAGLSRARRRPAPFSLRVPLPGKGVVLVDDVVTTGATIEAAAHPLEGIPSILSATGAGIVREPG